LNRLSYIYTHYCNGNKHCHLDCRSLSWNDGWVCSRHLIGIKKYLKGRKNIDKFENVLNEYFHDREFTIDDFLVRFKLVNPCCRYLSSPKCMAQKLLKNGLIYVSNRDNHVRLYRRRIL
jgi:hypothetical protein